MFGYYTLEELKSKSPSKAHGRTWKQELNYRKECIQIIQACGPPIKLASFTLHKAVVLLHRFFTRCSTTEYTLLRKWGVATACVFLATKIDSAYHRLESVVHVSFRALRQMQGRQLEPEYYNPDGTPGNPAFLAKLAAMVRDIEMDILFAINFDFNVEVPSVMVVRQLNELQLTEELEKTDRRVVNVRKQAMAAAVRSVNSVIILRYPARQLALAAISAACRGNGYPLDLSGVSGTGYTPVMSTQQLAVVEDALSKVLGGSATDSQTGGDGSTSGAAGGSSKQQGAGHGSGLRSSAAPGTPGGATSSFHNTAGEAAAATAAGVKGGAGVQCTGASTGDGSGSEAATVGPRIDPPPISPDSETGPFEQRLSGQQQQQQQRGVAAGQRAFGSAHQQQQQDQQQYRKRVREEGFGQQHVLLMGEPVQKKGSVVAA